MDEAQIEGDRVVPVEHEPKRLGIGIPKLEETSEVRQLELDCHIGLA